MTKHSALMLLLFVAWPLPSRADDAAAAREHYQRASNAYDLGHFSEAAKEFEAAYQLKNDPAFLFNIGQAYRFDGKNQQALLAYRAYLRRLPDAPNRAQVESRLAELKELIDKQNATESHPPTGTLTPNGESSAVVVAQPTTPPAPRETPLYKKWWVWTAVGGAVAIGLGVGLGVGLSGGDTNARTLPPVGGGL